MQRVFLNTIASNHAFARGDAIMSARFSRRLVLAVGLFLLLPSAMWAAPAKVYVILWFDTEDYLLPADDDAALHLADFLTHEGIRATFKVVGEKARTLERRKRYDVIAALKKHEIGYHSNWHSVQPSPAMYLSTLGWDEGVAEFDRREGPGRDDVERIFGRRRPATASRAARGGRRVTAP